MKIKVWYRKSLNMTPGKLAAQVGHAVLGLAELREVDPIASIVVLGASDTKFEREKQATTLYCVIYDAGRTEVPAGTATCFAFVEFEEEPSVHEGE